VVVVVLTVVASFLLSPCGTAVMLDPLLYLEKQPIVAAIQPLVAAMQPIDFLNNLLFVPFFNNKQRDLFF
jgi:hypothetical protein